MAMIRQPATNSTPIEHKGLHFLVTERPSDKWMSTYIDDLISNGVTTVVRICEATYSAEKIRKNGIDVVDLNFPDGQAPPQDVIDIWFDLLRTKLTEQPQACIAVHCVAGLGRAPLLVALALIERGMKYEDAVELIRSKRKGAINQKQLTFLSTYKPKSRLKNKKDANCVCV